MRPLIDREPATEKRERSGLGLVGVFLNFVFQQLDQRASSKQIFQRAAEC